jgi:hypothetical protein
MRSASAISQRATQAAQVQCMIHFMRSADALCAHVQRCGLPSVQSI